MPYLTDLLALVALLLAVAGLMRYPQCVAAAVSLLVVIHFLA